MYFPAVHAIQKEWREQQGTAFCLPRRAHACTCPSLFHTMCLVQHSRDNLYSIGLYVSCPIFCEKKLTSSAYMSVSWEASGCLAGPGTWWVRQITQDVMAILANAQGMAFFMQTFVHLWWPSTRTSSVSEVGCGFGGARVILEWKLISFGSSAWLLKFHLKALNPLRKIDGKHKIKDAFHICLTDEIWSLRPPCNVFNKMSTRENNTTSNHKKIFF